MTSVPVRQPDTEVAKPAHTMIDLVYEPGMLLGGGSAVMYQLAVWGVGKGVAQHSTTLQRPSDRLRTTLSFVYVMGLGTDEERKAIARMVNRAHKPIRGEGYTAFDPELQLWVASTLAEVGKQMWEIFYGPLDPESLEYIYKEGQIYGTILQVKPEMWPATRADFDRYWEQMQSEFRSDPEIREYAHKLLSAKHAQWHRKPLMPLISLVTRGNCSPQVRETLGFGWTDREQRLYDAFFAVVRPIYVRTPRWLRRLPIKLFMRDIRRRMAAGKRVI